MQIFFGHVKRGMPGKHRQASLTRVLSLGSGLRSVARRLAGHLAWRVNARSSPRPR
jgi:hypothetical protein